MVRIPDVFLLDEPLARIDQGLRQSARNELHAMQQAHRVTTLWATNDPAEAMAIADRVLVLDGGTVRAIGNPVALYDQPPNEFAAVFLGAMPMLVLDAAIDRDGARWRVEFGGIRVHADAPALDALAPGHVRVGVRTDDVEAAPAGVPATVVRTDFHGDHQVVAVDVSGTQLEMRDSSLTLNEGDEVEIEIAAIHLFDPATGDTVARVEHPVLR